MASEARSSRKLNVDSAYAARGVIMTIPLVVFVRDGQVGLVFCYAIASFFIHYLMVRETKGDRTLTAEVHQIKW